MKKILEIGLWHYSWDSRIFYKQAVSLSKEFEVKCLWWVFSTNKWTWNEEWIENIWISWNRIIVLFKAWFYGLQNKADIYVAHDIDSYFVVVWIKLFKWNSKIIFDSHEYYDLYNLSKYNLAWKIILTLFRKIIKPLTIRLFSWITVVTNDMKEFYTKVSMKEVIFNYPITTIFDKIESNHKLSNKNLYFIYHWWISEDRWIYEMVKIFEEYLKINKNIKFLLIWRFSTNKLKNEVMKTLETKWLVGHFIITWQLPLIETISYLKNDVRKIWFCLFDNVWQMSKSIPIKMLEYLYLEIPQVWWNHINSFNEIIFNNNTWIWVGYWSLDKEVKAVDEIFNNYNSFLDNCRKIKNDYTWGNEEKKLLEFYKKI